MELSETQRLAARTFGKNVCVSAGAGSGKTRVLVERFIYLVKEKKISPAEILAITFTEKAANEMKRRIVERLREEGLEEARREIENAAIGTIHSFCARILREHPLEAGVDPSFSILEAEEAEALQREALEEVLEALAEDPASGVFDLLRTYREDAVEKGVLGVYRSSRNSERPFEELLKGRSPEDRAFFENELKKHHPENGEKPSTIESLLTLKSGLRAAGKNKEAIRDFKEFLDDYAAFLREEAGLAVREVFVRLALQFESAYEEAKRTARALDFDDLQIRAVRLLAGQGGISRHLRKIYQEKFRQIMVDEFQDTNPLQDRLLNLIQRDANLFVVGDFKQSIYGFRGTQVEIFLEKEKAFGRSSKGQRISLVENYRTRPRLIEFINSFFQNIWREDGLPFEALVPIRQDEISGPRVEWLALAEKQCETLDEVRMREARTLARRILALIEEGHAYKEIACLFDAMRPSFFYEQEFRRAGIPYYVISSRDFYSQPEVRDVLSFLSALENPKQDIPLAAVLRSPLFQISEDTLVWLARRVKVRERGTPLMEAVQGFDSIEEIFSPDREKLLFFNRLFEDFLKEKEKLRISELIEKLFRETAYDLYVLKLRQGERRYANLRKLVEMAREMESKDSFHLGDFVRTVEAMETREVRESQAQVEAEEGNVVKLMSIHMSKGLEFPVVILPDLGGGENQGGGSFLLSEEGLGILAWDEAAEDFGETLTYRRNKRRLERLTSGESKRKLYVSMTRAREKIILAGPHKIADLKKTSFHEMSTWAEWVERILREGSWEVRRLEEAPPEPFPFEKRKALAERKPIRSKLETLSPLRLRRPSPEAEKILENLILPGKVDFERIDLPVSAFLLFNEDREAYFETYELGVPSSKVGARFIAPLGAMNGAPTIETKIEELGEEDPAVAAADFGTRVHQILEQIFLRRMKTAEIKPLVDRFNRDLSPVEREEIFNLAKRFLENPEAGEILKSKTVHPELSFALRLPHGLVYGTLDLIYQKGGGKWIILDYKTTSFESRGGVTPPLLQQRGEDYRVQLELYALAVHEIIGEAPAEARIHFLRPGLVYSIFFKPEDFGILFEKFTRLQKEILEFRKTQIASGASRPRNDVIARQRA